MIIVLILGAYPNAILNLLNTSLNHLNDVVRASSGAAVAMLH
jgi:NADH:ubiquinone oxidoreductase subunit 4 (subunit M)